MFGLVILFCAPFQVLQLSRRGERERERERESGEINNVLLLCVCLACLRSNVSGWQWNNCDLCLWHFLIKFAYFNELQ